MSIVYNSFRLQTYSLIGTWLEINPGSQRHPRTMVTVVIATSIDGSSNFKCNLIKGTHIVCRMDTTIYNRNILRIPLESLPVHHEALVCGDLEWKVEFETSVWDHFEAIQGNEEIKDVLHVHVCRVICTVYVNK